MGQYENSLGIDRPVIARVVTEDQRAVQRGQEPGGVILQRQGHTLAQSIAAEGVLYQSGIPFWIPPGDGGANGLNFTGTRGVFTLSAEAPMASAFNVLASGCYVYLPAGAGGLATGGWYRCYMIDGTNGEVFSETYSGTGQPAFVSSPTALPNLSAGRITQVITEILGPSFIMPGGSLGPNGVSRYTVKWFSSSTAGSKAVRLRAGGSVNWWATAMTNTFNDQLIQASRGNLGVQDRQIGNRVATAHGWDCGPSATTYSADVTTVDTSVDVTMTATAQIPANPDSIIMIPMLFAVEFGA
jgi:hypothetical protein